MKKILVAVSGGVDSIVLADFLIDFFKQKNGLKWVEDNLIIAHFEHGIRGEESIQDFEFVRKFAHKNNLQFEFERGFLGEKASEEKARKARYDFLKALAKRENAEIFTAHHKNDLAETFVMNLNRGGGWRAIACFDSPNIKRPFLKFSKAEILKKAQEKGLEWREDSTNSSEKYVRNRIRKKINFSEEDLNEIFEIWQKQIKIKREIEEITKEILSKIGNGRKFERNFFRNNPDEVCVEVLREIMRIQSGKIPLSKQIADFLQAIRTFKNGSKTQILSGREVRFYRDEFEFF